MAIFDARVTDTDARSYGNRPSAKVLENAEKEKCTKYERACRERQRDFTPLVYSVDKMPGRKAEAAEHQLARILAGKWEQQYSDVRNFVRVRMALAVVRSNSLLLRTERDKGVWKRRAPDSVPAALSGRVYRG
jgi:hypothetical protein